MQLKKQMQRLLFRPPSPINAWTFPHKGSFGHKIWQFATHLISVHLLWRESAIHYLVATSDGCLKRYCYCLQLHSWEVFTRPGQNLPQRPHLRVFGRMCTRNQHQSLIHYWKRAKQRHRSRNKSHALIHWLVILACNRLPRKLHLKKQTRSYHTYRSSTRCSHFYFSAPISGSLKRQNSIRPYVFFPLGNHRLAYSVIPSDCFVFRLHTYCNFEFNSPQVALLLQFTQRFASI